MSNIDVVVLEKKELREIIVSAIMQDRKVATIESELPLYPSIRKAGEVIGVSHTKLRQYVDEGILRPVYLEGSPTLRLDRSELPKIIRLTNI